ncbi:MAG: hypothetical protein RJA52_291, partial [Bacteroidota bacterium]
DFTKHFSEIQEEDFLVKENKIVNPLRLILFSVILIIFVPVVFISRKIIQMVSFPHPYFLFNTGTIYSKEELFSLINSDEIKDEYPIDGLLIVQKIKQSKDRRVNNYFLKPQGFTFLFKISLGIFKRYFYKEETIDA